LSTTYDQIAYPCAPQSQTHPDLLATLGTLHGLRAAPVDRCQVLEVGCNDGSNLIPMAANEPGSHFTGIDLAETAITAARSWSERLGLANTEFAQADILDWNPAGSRFDYILIHGLYSWVPPHVREAILSLSRTSLAPDGIAYISYNALPGCYIRRYVWDVLRFHTRDIEDPRQKIAAAREIAAKMCAWLVDEHQQPVLKKEFELLLTVHESVLLHDDLAEWNKPFSLSEFVEAAQRHGLQYLCDARFSRDSVHDLGLEGEEWLAARQYADFVTVRKFRSSLLCHAGSAIDHTIRTERLMGVFASSPAEPQPEQSDGTQTFKLGDEKSLSTNHPVAKRILTELFRIWPACRPVSELPFGSLARDAAAALVLRLYEARALELRIRPPRLVSTVTERPVASSLARLQIASGQTAVTNQRHVSVMLTDELSRQFLLLLDGSRDRAALLRDLTGCLDSGDPSPAWHANGPASRLERTLMIDKGLDGNLAQMARLCLLVA
jgi:ubiquinone/menaquinone biosynthesis C-methylase UbiE